MKVYPPLYLMGRKINCWRCKSRTSIIGLLAPSVDYPEEFIDPEDPDALEEPLIPLYIEHVPDSILRFMQKLVPGFKLQNSYNAGEEYFGNSCASCGALIGDNHIHSRPGGAFYPTNDDEAKLIYLTEVPLSEPTDISADASIGRGQMILDNAHRITPKTMKV